MHGYVEFVQKHRKQLFIILILVNLLSLIGIFKIKISSDFQIFMPERSQYKDILDEMNQTFKTSDQIMFLLEDDTPELTVERLEEFRDFQSSLEMMDNVEQIKGPAPQVVMAGIQTINIDNINQDNLQQLENYYEKIGKLSPLVKKEGHLYGIFTLFPDQNFSKKDLNSIEDYLKNHQITYYASGDLYMQQKIIDYVLLILCFLPPIAIVLILSVFRLQMGSLKATILSIIPAGIAALWTIGIIGWLGQKVSVVTVLAPVFTIVIGSADGLHFISHVQEERSDGKNKIQSIVETLRMVGIPMIITTVTSMAGFLSLLVMNTNAIKDLAIFATTGIFLAGVATWYVLPIVLTGKITLKRPNTHRENLTIAIKKLWGRPAVVIVVIVLIGSILSFQLVNTEFNQLMLYKNYTQVHKGFEKIMEINQGSIPVFLQIKTEHNPLDPAYAKELLALETDLTNSKYVGKTISVYDFYSTIYSLFLNLKDSVYPTQLTQVNMISSLLSRLESDPTSQLINQKEQVTRIMVFPGDLRNQTLDQINQRIKTFNQVHDDLEIKVTGVQYLMRDLNQNMIDNQAKSLVLAFILIFILLLISLRKIKPTLISLLPIGCTVIFLYGFLGLSGISLNVFTTTIFSITIGVGIDYAIHFTSIWMSFRKKGYNSAEATDKAYSYTSRPILANAFGLAIGLSALLLSPLRIHLYVSVLMWGAMIAGVFLSLSFLPTMLRKTKL